MRLWAWLHLPSALAATSTKTVVVAGLLVGLTTTATAGVVVLGSSAVRPPAIQGQQTVPHLGASGQLGRTPVVVVPRIHPPTAAAAEPTPSVPSNLPATSSLSVEPISTVAAASTTGPASPIPPRAAAQPATTTLPNATTPNAATAPATAKASATTRAPVTAPSRAAATSKAPAPTPVLAVPAQHAPQLAASSNDPTPCGTITASQAERAVVAQYSCGPKNAANGTPAEHADNGRPDDRQSGEHPRNHVQHP